MNSEERSITSAEALNEELESVILRAYRSGVDVKGGFDCRNGVEHPDWDVIVTEVEKNEPSE